jgi:hypothetical protein
VHFDDGTTAFEPSWSTYVFAVSVRIFAPGTVVVPPTYGITVGLFVALRDPVDHAMDPPCEIQSANPTFDVPDAASPLDPLDAEDAGAVVVDDAAAAAAAAEAESAAALASFSC